jgi:hypothetical protein
LALQLELKADGLSNLLAQALVGQLPNFVFQPVDIQSADLVAQRDRVDSQASRCPVGRHRFTQIGQELGIAGSVLDLLQLDRFFVHRLAITQQSSHARVLVKRQDDTNGSASRVTDELSLQHCCRHGSPHVLHKLDIAHFTISAVTVLVVFYPTAPVSPICTQVERTDRLIAQVVYRLYGLTEAEIAVVEGADCAPRTDWRTDQTAL